MLRTVINVRILSIAGREVKSASCTMRMITVQSRQLTDFFVQTFNVP